MNSTKPPTAPEATKCHAERSGEGSDRRPVPSAAPKHVRGRRRELPEHRQRQEFRGEIYSESQHGESPRRSPEELYDLRAVLMMDIIANRATTTWWRSRGQDVGHFPGSGRFPQPKAPQEEIMAIRGVRCADLRARHHRALARSVRAPTYCARGRRSKACRTPNSPPNQLIPACPRYRFADFIVPTTVKLPRKAAVSTAGKRNSQQEPMGRAMFHPGVW